MSASTTHSYPPVPDHCHPPPPSSNAPPHQCQCHLCGQATFLGISALVSFLPQVENPCLLCSKLQGFTPKNVIFMAINTISIKSIVQDIFGCTPLAVMSGMGQCVSRGRAGSTQQQHSSSSAPFFWGRLHISLFSFPSDLHLCMQSGRRR